MSLVKTSESFTTARCNPPVESRLPQDTLKTAAQSHYARLPLQQHLISVAQGLGSHHILDRAPLETIVEPWHANVMRIPTELSQAES